MSLRTCFVALVLCGAHAQLTGMKVHLHGPPGDYEAEAVCTDDDPIERVVWEIPCEVTGDSSSVEYRMADGAMMELVYRSTDCTGPSTSRAITNSSCERGAHFSYDYYYSVQGVEEVVHDQDFYLLTKYYDEACTNLLWGPHLYIHGECLPFYGASRQAFALGTSLEILYFSDDACWYRDLTRSDIELPNETSCVQNGRGYFKFTRVSGIPWCNDPTVGFEEHPGSRSGSQKCPDNNYVVAENRCAAAKCSPRDKPICCNAKQRCNDAVGGFEESPSTKAHALKCEDNQAVVAEAFCAKGACSRDDARRCCAPKQQCGDPTYGFQESTGNATSTKKCAQNQVVVGTSLCAGPVCSSDDAAVCCVAKQACDVGFQVSSGSASNTPKCADGQLVLQDSYCAGPLCTASDASSCCTMGTTEVIEQTVTENADSTIRHGAGALQLLLLLACEAFLQ